MILLLYEPTISLTKLVISDSFCSKSVQLSILLPYNLTINKIQIQMQMQMQIQMQMQMQMYNTNANTNIQYNTNTIGTCIAWM